MEYRIEVVLMPVSDVDRAKRFYMENVGFRLDVDHDAGESFRVVQLTPPGSSCSIIFGIGITDAEPGSVRGTHLVVTDVQAACEDLASRGVEVLPIHHFEDGQRVDGLDPERRDYGSYSGFTDPDGNTWVLQEVPTRNG